MVRSRSSSTDGIDRALRLASLTLTYAWAPIAYTAVYVPLILPRLQSWQQIPAVVPVAFAAPLVAALFVLGYLSSQREMVLHATLSAVVLHLLEFAGAQIGLPGLQKSQSIEAPALFWRLMLPVSGLAVLVIEEAGGLVRKALHYRSGSS